MPPSSLPPSHSQIPPALPPHPPFPPIRTIPRVFASSLTPTRPPSHSALAPCEDSQSQHAWSKSNSGQKTSDGRRSHTGLPSKAGPRALGSDHTALPATRLQAAAIQSAVLTHDLKDSVAPPYAAVTSGQKYTWWQESQSIRDADLDNMCFANEVVLGDTGNPSPSQESSLLSGDGLPLNESSSLRLGDVPILLDDEQGWTASPSRDRKASDPQESNVVPFGRRVRAASHIAAPRLNTDECMQKSTPKQSCGSESRQGPVTPNQAASFTKLVQSCATNRESTNREKSSPNVVKGTPDSSLEPRVSESRRSQLSGSSTGVKGIEVGSTKLSESERKRQKLGQGIWIREQGSSRSQERSVRVNGASVAGVDERDSSVTASSNGTGWAGRGRYSQGSRQGLARNEAGEERMLHPLVLNRHLANAQSWIQLRSQILRYHSCFDHIHVTAAVARTAKLVGRAGAEQEDVRATLQLLSNCLLLCMHRLQLQDLCSLIWSFGTLRFILPPLTLENLLSHLSTQATNQLSHSPPTTIARVAGALSVLSRAYTSSPHARLSPTASHHIQILWSCIQSSVMENLGALSLLDPAQLSHLLGALSRAGMMDSMVQAAVMEALKPGLLAGAPNVSLSTLTELLRASSTIAPEPERSTKHQAGSSDPTYSSYTNPGACSTHGSDRDLQSRSLAFDGIGSGNAGSELCNDGNELYIDGNGLDNDGNGLYNDGNEFHDASCVDGRFTELLAGAIMPRLSICSVKELTAVATACAHGEIKNGDLLSTLARVLSERAGELDVRGVANCAWAVAVFWRRQENERWDHIPQKESNTRDDELPQGGHNVPEREEDREHIVSGSELGYGKNNTNLVVGHGVLPDHQRIRSTVTSFCEVPNWRDVLGQISSAAARKLPHLKPQHMSMLCWALATTQLYDPHLMQQLALQILACCSTKPRSRSNTFKRLSPQGIANIAWAFSHLGHHHPTLVGTLAGEAVQQLPSFKPLEVCSLLYAMANAGVTHQDLLVRVDEMLAGKMMSMIQQGDRLELGQLQPLQLQQAQVLPQQQGGQQEQQDCEQQQQILNHAGTDVNQTQFSANSNSFKQEQYLARETRSWNQEYVPEYVPAGTAELPLNGMHRTVTVSETQGFSSTTSGSTGHGAAMSGSRFTLAQLCLVSWAFEQLGFTDACTPSMIVALLQQGYAQTAVPGQGVSLSIVERDSKSLYRPGEVVAMQEEVDWRSRMLGWMTDEGLHDGMQGSRSVGADRVVTAPCMDGSVGGVSEDGLQSRSQASMYGIPSGKENHSSHICRNTSNSSACIINDNMSTGTSNSSACSHSDGVGIGDVMQTTLLVHDDESARVISSNLTSFEQRFQSTAPSTRSHFTATLDLQNAASTQRSHSSTTPSLQNAASTHPSHSTTTPSFQNAASPCQSHFTSVPELQDPNSPTSSLQPASVATSLCTNTSQRPKPSTSNPHHPSAFILAADSLDPWSHASQQLLSRLMYSVIQQAVPRFLNSNPLSLVPNSLLSPTSSTNSAPHASTALFSNLSSNSFSTNSNSSTNSNLSTNRSSSTNSDLSTICNSSTNRNSPTNRDLSTNLSADSSRHSPPVQSPPFGSPVPTSTSPAAPTVHKFTVIEPIDHIPPSDPHTTTSGYPLDVPPLESLCLDYLLHQLQLPESAGFPDLRANGSNTDLRYGDDLHFGNSEFGNGAGRQEQLVQPLRRNSEINRNASQVLPAEPATDVQWWVDDEVHGAEVRSVVMACSDNIVSTVLNTAGCATAESVDRASNCRQEDENSIAAYAAAATTSRTAAVSSVPSASSAHSISGDVFSFGGKATAAVPDAGELHTLPAHTIHAARDSVIEPDSIGSTSGSILQGSPEGFHSNSPGSPEMFHKNAPQGSSGTIPAGVSPALFLSKTLDTMILKAVSPEELLQLVQACQQDMSADNLVLAAKQSAVLHLRIQHEQQQLPVIPHAIISPSITHTTLDTLSNHLLNTSRLFQRLSPTHIANLLLSWADASYTPPPTYLTRLLHQLQRKYLVRQQPSRHVQAAAIPAASPAADTRQRLTTASSPPSAEASAAAAEFASCLSLAVTGSRPCASPTVTESASFSSATVRHSMPWSSATATDPMPWSSTTLTPSTPFSSASVRDSMSCSSAAVTDSAFAAAAAQVVSANASDVLATASGKSPSDACAGTTVTAAAAAAAAAGSTAAGMAGTLVKFPSEIPAGNPAPYASSSSGRLLSLATPTALAHLAYALHKQLDSLANRVQHSCDASHTHVHPNTHHDNTQLNGSSIASASHSGNTNTSPSVFSTDASCYAHHELNALLQSTLASVYEQAIPKLPFFLPKHAFRLITAHSNSRGSCPPEFTAAVADWAKDRFHAWDPRDITCICMALVRSVTTTPPDITTNTTHNTSNNTTQTTIHTTYNTTNHTTTGPHPSHAIPTAHVPSTTRHNSSHPPANTHSVQPVHSHPLLHPNLPSSPPSQARLPFPSSPSSPSRHSPRRQAYISASAARDPHKPLPSQCTSSQRTSMDASVPASTPTNTTAATFNHHTHVSDKGQRTRDKGQHARDQGQHTRDEQQHARDQEHHASDWSSESNADLPVSFTSSSLPPEAHTQDIPVSRRPDFIHICLSTPALHPVMNDASNTIEFARSHTYTHTSTPATPLHSFTSDASSINGALLLRTSIQATAVQPVQSDVSTLNRAQLVSKAVCAVSALLRAVVVSVGSNWMAEFSCRDLVCLTRAATCLLREKLPGRFLQDAVHVLLPHVGQMQARDLACVLWAVAAADSQVDSTFLAAAAQRACQLAPAFSPIGLSSTLWALGRLRVDDSAEQLIPPLLVQAHLMIPQCTSREMASVLWAAARMQVYVGEFMEGAAEAVGREAGSMGTQELVMCAWALSKLRHHQPHTMHAVSLSAASRLSHMRPREIACMCHALQALNTPHPYFFTPLAAILPSQLQSTTEQGLAMLLNACATQLAGCWLRNHQTNPGFWLRNQQTNPSSWSQNHQIHAALGDPRYCAADQATFQSVQPHIQSTEAETCAGSDSYAGVLLSMMAHIVEELATRNPACMNAETRLLLYPSLLMHRALTPSRHPGIVADPSTVQGQPVMDAHAHLTAQQASSAVGVPSNGVNRDASHDAGSGRRDGGPRRNAHMLDNASRHAHMLDDARLLRPSQEGRRPGRSSAMPDSMRQSMRWQRQSMHSPNQSMYSQRPSLHSEDQSRYSQDQPIYLQQQAGIRQERSQGDDVPACTSLFMHCQETWLLASRMPPSSIVTDVMQHISLMTGHAAHGTLRSPRKHPLPARNKYTSDSRTEEHGSCSSASIFGEHSNYTSAFSIEEHSSCTSAPRMDVSGIDACRAETEQTVLVQDVTIAAQQPHLHDESAICLACLCVNTVVLGGVKIAVEAPGIEQFTRQADSAPLKMTPGQMAGSEDSGQKAGFDNSGQRFGLEFSGHKSGSELPHLWSASGRPGLGRAAPMRGDLGLPRVAEGSEPKCSNAPKVFEMGGLAIRRGLLQLAGLEVLVVKPHEWQTLESAGERREYLWRKLREVVGNIGVVDQLGGR